MQDHVSRSLNIVTPSGKLKLKVPLEETGSEIMELTHKAFVKLASGPEVVELFAIKFDFGTVKTPEDTLDPDIERLLDEFKDVNATQRTKSNNVNEKLNCLHGRKTVRLECV